MSDDDRRSSPRRNTQTSAVALVKPLFDGKTNSTIIVDSDGKITGVVTQSNLLAALSGCLSIGNLGSQT